MSGATEEHRLSLPDSYTVKPNAIRDYFDAILQAQPPERFSTRFLEGLGFKSTNDRLIVGVLKDLGFLDSDAAPPNVTFAILTVNSPGRILAEGIARSLQRSLCSQNKRTGIVD